VVRARDADLAVSFTGLGNLEGEWTGDWLLERIGHAKAAESGFDECVEAVREGADAAFGSIAAKHGRPVPHTFVFAGYHHGAERPRVVVVTNCESGNFRAAPVANTFSVRDMSSARYPYHQAGMLPALRQDSKSEIRGLTRKTHSHPAVADLVVQEVRAAASHGKYGRYVGKECMCVCALKSGEVQAIYYPTHTNQTTYAPNLIDLFPAQGGGLGHMAIKGMSRTTGGGFQCVGPSGLRLLDRRELTRLPVARRSQ